MAIILCTVLKLYMCVKATAAPGHGERQLSCPLFPLPTVCPVPMRGSLCRIFHVATGFSVVQRLGTLENSTEDELVLPNSKSTRNGPPTSREKATGKGYFLTV